MAGAFIMQGAFLVAIYGQNLCYPDRSAGDRIGLLLPSRGDLGRLHRPGADAASQPLDFTVRMLIATRGAAIVLVVNLQFSLETRGKELVPQLTLVAESSAAV